MAKQDIKIYDLIFSGKGQNEPNNFVQIVVNDEEHKQNTIKNLLEKARQRGDYVLSFSKRNRVAEAYYKENPEKLNYDK